MTPPTPPPRSRRHVEVRVWTLTVAVVAVLVGFVWVSVYVLSAAQGYVRAEGLYVKSLLVAVSEVRGYAESGDPRDLAGARASLETPLGYHETRLLLLADPLDPGGEARARLQAAGYGAREASRIAGLFPALHRAPALAPAYRAWAEGDVLTTRLESVVAEAERAVLADGPGSPAAAAAAARAAEVAARALPLGRQFSATIERGTESIRVSLVVGSLVLGLALALVSGAHAVRFVRRLRAADVEARRDAERLAEAAGRAQAHAEEHLRLKTSLLHNMSHEIRTPLTAILGFAELLAEGVAPEDRDLALGIVRGGTRLRHTLDSVLEHAQLEAGHVRALPTDVDVAAEAADAVRTLQPLAAARGLALTVDASGPVPARVDARALGRIVTNLVGNAIKFTEAGGVTVSVGATGDGVEVAVADTGVGMTAAELARVFNAFQQASEGIGRHHEGNGLGLAITERLVSILGGRVSVESEPGRGTTFRVRLPCGTPTAGGPAVGAGYEPTPELARSPSTPAYSQPENAESIAGVMT